MKIMLFCRNFNRFFLMLTLLFIVSCGNKQNIQAPGETSLDKEDELELGIANTNNCSQEEVFNPKSKSCEKVLVNFRGNVAQFAPGNMNINAQVGLYTYNAKKKKNVLATFIKNEKLIFVSDCLQQPIQAKIVKGYAHLKVIGKACKNASLKAKYKGIEVELGTNITFLGEPASLKFIGLPEAIHNDSSIQFSLELDDEVGNQLDFPSGSKASLAADADAGYLNGTLSQTSSQISRIITFSGIKIHSTNDVFSIRATYGSSIIATQNISILPSGSLILKITPETDKDAPISAGSSFRVVASLEKKNGSLYTGLSSISISFNGQEVTQDTKGGQTVFSNIVAPNKVGTYQLTASASLASGVHQEIIVENGEPENVILKNQYIEVDVPTLVSFYVIDGYGNLALKTNKQASDFYFTDDPKITGSREASSFVNGLLTFSNLVFLDSENTSSQMNLQMKFLPSFSAHVELTHLTSSLRFQKVTLSEKNMFGVKVVDENNELIKNQGTAFVMIRGLNFVSFRTININPDEEGLYKVALGDYDRGSYINLRISLDGVLDYDDWINIL